MSSSVRLSVVCRLSSVTFVHRTNVTDDKRQLRCESTGLTVNSRMTIETKMCRNICVDNWDNAENKYIPQNLEWGTLMQIVPIRFCHVSKFQAPDCSKHQHVGTKRSVLWLSKYAKIRFRPGLYPGPSWRKLTTLSRPVSRLGR